MSRTLRTAVLGLLALVGSALWLVDPAIARPPHGSSRVRCESQARRHTYCRTGAYGRVLLERRLSDAPCREYDTWVPILTALACGCATDAGRCSWCRRGAGRATGRGRAPGRDRDLKRSGSPANPRASAELLPPTALGPGAPRASAERRAVPRVRHVGCERRRYLGGSRVRRRIRRALIGRGSTLPSIDAADPATFRGAGPTRRTSRRGQRKRYSSRQKSWPKRGPHDYPPQQ
jgi:hypothetical protein